MKWSPTMDYFSEVFCPNAARMGMKISSKTERYGFFPKGGGIVKIEIKPSRLDGTNFMEKGKLSGIIVKSVASSGLAKGKVCDRQSEAALKVLGNAKVLNIYTETDSPGSALHAQAEYENCTIGADCLGERGKKSEDVGKEGAMALKKEMNTGKCLDIHMADQIIPFMALAKGRSSATISQASGHLKTNIMIVEKFLGKKFELKGSTIRCKGM